MTTSEDHPEVVFLARRVVNDLIGRRLVRGSHVGAVLASLDAGHTMPMSTIVAVAPARPPDE